MLPFREAGFVQELSEQLLDIKKQQSDEEEEKKSDRILSTESVINLNRANRLNLSSVTINTWVKYENIMNYLSDSVTTEIPSNTEDYLHLFDNTIEYEIEKQGTYYFIFVDCSNRAK